MELNKVHRQAFLAHLEEEKKKLETSRTMAHDTKLSRDVRDMSVVSCFLSTETIQRIEKAIIDNDADL